jgi:hypothetical protein
MNIVEAMSDPVLFQPWFRGRTWDNWRTVLKAAYALPMSDIERSFFRIVAERDPPKKRVRETWICAGRRSGKDSVASLITAYSASMFDRKQGKLRRGEKALCSCLASDRDQSKIVLNYVRSYFDDLPLLRSMLGRNTATGFDLSNSVDVSITTNSFRAVRGAVPSSRRSWTNAPSGGTSAAPIPTKKLIEPSRPAWPRSRTPC